MTFWDYLDISLLSQLIGLGVTAWLVGYKIGYTLFVTRYLINKAT